MRPTAPCRPEIWALEDEAKAASEAAAAAEKLRTAWTQITDSLIAEVKRIRGVMGGGSVSYSDALAQFNAATAAARTGDQEAAQSLPRLSQALLTAAGNMATSAEGLARIQGQTAGSLEETLAIHRRHAGTGGATTTAVSQPSWWDQFAAGQTPGVVTAANDSGLAIIDELQGLRQELSDLRAEQMTASARTFASGPNGKTARILERVTPDGDAIAVRTAA